MSMRVGCSWRGESCRALFTEGIMRTDAVQGGFYLPDVEAFEMINLRGKRQKSWDMG